ncbi:hypothetical protein DM806_17430 [Sphingobium lactosutens]|uniref:Zn-ribbon domain-containing OB-fold protein n=1 Tax=Sphingobium lactosutens TaxID=522773 RepID=UPI0015C0F205|nr:OB-fold domain-containing protein [Sphingobium lactosutens]NWK97416.1 hypothetical protein [Sphingobium lactosutens]
MDIPFPRPNADTRPYWDAAARHQLVYQFCEQCQKSQFFPRATCVQCDSLVQWRVSKGQGTIASFTEVFRGPTAAFKSMSPYIIALIDLDEGFRMMANIIDSNHADVVIGGRTVMVFQDIGGWTLPQAKLP